MAWVRIDDQAPRNAKLLRAGPAAAWMWVCGIAHAQAQMTEGFIPDIAIGTIGIAGAERSRKLANVLVSCGLFDRIDGGYMVHDYLEHNQTREEALARKVTLGAKRAAAGRAGGIQSGIARSHEATKQTIEAKRSPDPTRPDLNKNPPTPFQGARLKRAELKEATELRNRVYGGCPHEPKCGKTKKCVEAIALSRRAS